MKIPIACNAIIATVNNNLHNFSLIFLMIGRKTDRERFIFEQSLSIIQQAGTVIKTYFTSFLWHSKYCSELETYTDHISYIY